MTLLEAKWKLLSQRVLEVVLGLRSQSCAQMYESDNRRQVSMILSLRSGLHANAGYKRQSNTSQRRSARLQQHGLVAQRLEARAQAGRDVRLQRSARRGGRAAAVHVRAAQDRAVQLEAPHDRRAGAACSDKLVQLLTKIG